MPECDRPPMLGIRGYCDRPSVAPGERLSFYVSADAPGEYETSLIRFGHPGGLAAEGAGVSETVVPSSLDGRRWARRQRTQVGTYVEVDAFDWPELPSVGVQAFVCPTLPEAGRQGLVAHWDDARAAGWALTLEDGRATFEIGDGSGGRAQVRGERPLFAGIWYSLAAGFDRESGALVLFQRPVVTSANGRFGPVVPLDGASERRVATQIRPWPADAPVLLGGLAEGGAGGRRWVVDAFHGKLDAPKVFAAAPRVERLPAWEATREQGDALVARWDFAAGIRADGIPTDHVRDLAAGGHHGTCVNQPDRAATGWNWSGREDNFRHAPEEYGALWFHADALDDARWEEDFALHVPPSLESGCYAVRLRQGDAVDDVPFFVRPAPSGRRARVAVLMSTFTYMAYGNTGAMPTWSDGAGWAVSDPNYAGPMDVDEAAVELALRPADYGVSIYETHADGRGVQYSSWRRPLLSMRPHGPLWNYVADLHLIDWLALRGIECDVITDHDLHHEGADLLRHYKAVLTGSHPEYWSGAMIDAWETWLVEGGRGMYLGGNGMYWVTSLHPRKPWLIEVRRGESGDSTWHSPPGEEHHSTTGEKGGLWRFRGRAPQKAFGTGYTSHGWGNGAPYRWLSDARDPRAAWLLEGIDVSEPLGDHGLTGGGAAALELDRYDLALGTPPHTLLVATSEGHDWSFVLVPEDQGQPYPGQNGVEHPLVRADITLFSTPRGGAMFASSSIGWVTSLHDRGCENGVSRLTENVLRAFMADAPVPGTGDGQPTAAAEQER